MTDSLFVELKQLRRGHGLRSHDVVERIGPHLRQICGISSSDSPAEARGKLTLRITQDCGRLPEPFGYVASVAFALDRGSNRTERRFLHQRVKDLAASFDRDPRTALRRIDQALYMLAELMAGPVRALDTESDSIANAGWYTEHLGVTLHLTDGAVRLIEERRIVATAEELDEIVVSYSFSQAQGNPDTFMELEAVMGFGGELVEERRVGRSHVDFTVRLPEPIGMGQYHDYSIVIASSLLPRSILPYYVVTPWRNLHSLRMRLCFGQDVPKAIWRINGLPPAVLGELETSDDLLSADSLGEVQSEFHQLRLALSYGVGWLY